MKKIVSLATVLSAASLFAAEEPNVDVVSFTLTEPAVYSDGTAVADGECLAIVWSADGTFEGIKADGGCVDANDRIVYRKACIKDGLGDITIQVSKDVKFGETYAYAGVYGCYVLDTRKFTGATDATGGAIYTVGAENPINSATVISSKMEQNGSFVTTADTTAGKTVVASALPAEIQPPKITKMTLGDDTITLEVEGTSALANYAAKATTKLGEADAGATTGTPKNGNGGTMTLIVPKPTGSSGFVSIIRK